MVDNQSIDLATLPAMTYGGTAYTLPANSTKGLPLTWTSSNEDVAVISNGSIRVIGAGTAIITATQAGNENYLPMSKEYTLTVAKASLTITADDATRNVGEANPAFTAKYEGFVNGDDASVLTTQPVLSTTATEDSPVGSYDITVTGAAVANYDITYVKGTLTVVGNSETENSFSMSDVLCIVGKQCLLPISMRNSESIKGLQFDLRLPEGVTVATDGDGELMFALTDRAHSSHIVTSRRLDNGDYRVVVLSMNAKPFKGTEGAVMNVTLSVAEDATAGSYEIQQHSIILNTVDNVTVKPDDVTARMTLSDTIYGDVNGDGLVNVTDVGMVIDHILEQMPSGFIVEIADINDDGVVNVTDVGLIINIILSDDLAREVLQGDFAEMLEPQ